MATGAQFPILATTTTSRATLWILANLVHYLVQNRRTMSLEEYIDYLPRSRWKKYQENKRWETVGNYLEIL